MDLLIFDNIENDECINGIVNKDNTIVLRNIIRFAESQGVTNNSMREYIASFLANDKNIISTLAQKGLAIGDDLYKIALLDIERIYEKLFSVPQMKYSTSGNETGFSSSYKNSIAEITSSKSAKELLDNLIAHYRKNGCGEIARYITFKYNGCIKGIKNIEATSFDDLIGLDEQKKIISDNTQAFLDGKKAENVLVYGDKGTGKSSLIKALPSMFEDKGLRIVEVLETDLAKISEIMQILNDKPNKYILFIDGITFNNDKYEYNLLESAMEGQLQNCGDNVLIYATTNVACDTFSDRFGVTVKLEAPSWEEYTNILSELLKKHNIEFNADIEKAATEWQEKHGSVSRRWAKRFVEDYILKN